MDIIVLIVGILIIVVVGIVELAKTIRNRLFRKNCFKCKHWDLCDVASMGNGCKYRCKKTGFRSGMIDMNLNKYYKKCNEFEEK